MRGFAKAIVLVPLALLAVAFAVRNRASSVSLFFDPLSAGTAGLAIDAPLFVVTLILGVLLGGIATWIGQGRYRRAARMHRRDVERLRNDLDRMRTSSTSI